MTVSGGITGADLSRDHVGLSETLAARRYFRMFEEITGHLPRVAAAMEADGLFSRLETGVLAEYLERIAGTFRALGTKYLMTGRDTGTFFGSLAIDVTESGFPVFRELLTMASDFAQAEARIAGTPDRAALLDRMVEEIVGRLSIPTRLQFALSQRLYFESLLEDRLFWSQNAAQSIWLSGLEERRRFLLHWSVYDTELNLPVIYLMEVEDSGRVSLAKDATRWPAVQAHLAAQSVAGLKLLTIAKGFDTDFSDLHPKRLRRLHVGPMYSAAYTRQTGPIREVLEEAAASGRDDWALVWTLEDLESERVETERSGWFSTVEREVFALDPFAGRGADTGATRTERFVILPERPFQVLSERNPPGFSGVRKFVVAPGGRVLVYR
ncbi:hypothetical protein [Oceaniglobus roseus]|uniref:hypothetical protein n=1 Tax=Oceaniglobus roseus TaxID=1737570 RepID=UPI001FE58C62|nr:hypothetical protein [Kandeliimicrobium roseum]